MLQLICHHTYDTWSGLPIDRSKYGLSNGTNIGADFLPDGSTPGSGALQFLRKQNVRVPTSQAWQNLGAINIYTREVANHLVTVVGETPAASVRRIADRVEFKRPQ